MASSLKVNGSTSVASNAEIQRIAGQVAGVDQSREQRIQNDERLSLAAGGEWSRERTPVRIRASDLATGHDPTLRWLRVCQKPPLNEQVFVGERGARLALFCGKPQQQAFGLRRRE
jgi:hypothetical protein